MARAAAVAFALIYVLTLANAAPLVKTVAKAKVVAKGKAKVAVKGKAKVAKPDACQLAQRLCDFKYGPAVKTFNVHPVVGNQILSKANILTKDGKPVTTASIYGCSIYGNSIAPCNGFQMITDGNPFFLGSDKYQKILKYPYLGTSQLTNQGASFIKGKCIVLRLDDFEIAGTTFINKGAQTALYPTARRCLIIRTV